MKKTAIGLMVCFMFGAWQATQCLYAQSDGDGRYTVRSDEYGSVIHTPDGKPLLRYMTEKPADSLLTANSVCCLYPVYSPKGVSAVEFATSDHRHHRGIFLAWHASTCDGKRADFWGWGSWAPTEGVVITNRDVRVAKADEDLARLEIHNDWKVAGKTVIGETLTLTARQVPAGNVIDLAYRFVPSVEVELDQTAFGGFCVKNRHDGQAVYTSPEGIVNLPPPHHLKPETDWPDAPWYDYTVTLEDGNRVGVAVMSHPNNPPTVWHNLGAIAMLNPCIVAKKPVKLHKGQPLTLRYRVVVHDGPPPTEQLNRLAEKFGQE